MRAIPAALAALALALVAPAAAVDQPSTYPGCAERQAEVPWSGAVTVDLSACQSFGLGVLATPPAHGRAGPAPDAPAEHYVYVHDGAGGSEDRFVVLDDNSDRIVVHVRIGPPTLGVALAPESLPALRAGAAVDLALQAAGGQAPYAFRLSAGTLPEGLALDAAGRLAGMPTRRGPFAFELLARDARGAEGRRAYAGDVAPGVFALAPEKVAVVKGQPFEVRLSAAGGVAPLRFALEPGHGLPAGVVLSEGGVLRGVTASTASDFRARVRITDASTGPGESFEIESFVLTLVPPPAISLSLAPAGAVAPSVLVVDRGQALAVPTRVAIRASREVAGLPATVLILPGERQAEVALALAANPDGAAAEPLVLTVEPGTGYRAGARLESRVREPR